MKHFTLLAGLAMIMGLGLMACEDTTEATCDPVCGENQTCNTELDTPACECNVGFKMKSDNSGCVAECPATDPCEAKYIGASCVQEGDAAPTCKCDEGFVYRATDDKCVSFNTVLVLGIGGSKVASATEGPDVDAIGIKKAAAADTTWCAAETDVMFHAVSPAHADSDVDAAHQTKGAVVGAPNGDANTAASYHSLGLPNGEDKGWISCKFATTYIVATDTLQVAEVTGANAATEPFDVYACYDQIEATALAPCVKIGSEAVGSGPSATTTFDFVVPATLAEEIPAGLPAAE